jgi:hypothetical protein
MLNSALLVSMTLLLQGASVPASLAVRLQSTLGECPSREEVESALRQVIGDGASSAAGWILQYERVLPEGASADEAPLAIRLVTPAGDALVERRIVVVRSDCPAVAGAIAAVVERSLRSIGWTRGEPLPVPAQLASPQPGTATRERPPWFVLGAGPSLVLLSEGSDKLGSNLLFQVRARAWGPLCVRLGTGLLSTSDNRDVGNVATQMTSRFVSLTPLAAFLLGRTELAIGPSASLGIDSATSSLGGSGYRATLAVGLATSVAVRLSPRWRLGVGLEGLHAALGADYVVELAGVKTVVLAPPAWRGAATAQLEIVPWP